MDATDAFERLFHEMVPKVHRFAATRLGDSAAEDLVADVFHAAAVAYNDGRREQVTPAWVMAVARNKVIDRWREAERRSAIALRHRGRADDYVEFPADWTADARREDVLAALDRMRPTDRHLLVLHYLDGMTQQSIADALDCSLAAVQSRLARARRAFRSSYRPRGLRHA